MAPVQDLAKQILLTCVDLCERDLDLADDAHGAIGAIGDRGEGIYGGDLHREFWSPHASQICGQDQEIGPVGEWWQTPGEMQRETVQIGRVVVFVEFEHEVFEREQDPGVYLEGQVQIEGAAAGIFRMQVDLPGLTEGVGLDEMTLVVHVKSVVDGVIFEIGDEAGDIDDRHMDSRLRGELTP